MVSLIPALGSLGRCHRGCARVGSWEVCAGLWCTVWAVVTSQVTQNAPESQVLFSVLCVTPCVQFYPGNHVLVHVLSMAITLWNSSFILTGPARAVPGHPGVSTVTSDPLHFQDVKILPFLMCACTAWAFSLRREENPLSLSTWLQPTTKHPTTNAAAFHLCPQLWWPRLEPVLCSQWNRLFGAPLAEELDRLRGCHSSSTRCV